MRSGDLLNLMTIVSVLYPNKPGAKFDMDYYLSSHIPMVERVLAPAIRKVTVEKGVGGAMPGTDAAYLVVADLHFDSPEAFGAAFGPVAGQIQGDVPNYTDIEPIVQVNEVLK
jgi:uncharacterized protein (TIGR02118 family)